MVLVLTKKRDKTLKQQLDEKKSAFELKASNEKKRIYKNGIETIEKSGIIEAALKVGDKAPDFTLKNALSQDISLYKTIQSGPVVLTWYRGGWCPYCNITLAQLQQDLPEFTKMGAQILALTPELPDSSLSTKEKHQLDFEVLSDVGNKVARSFGVVFTLTPEVAEIYQKSFGLHQFNGDSSNELPLAATYIIDSEGIVQYAFLDADYRNRAEPLELINVLKRIQK